MRARVAAFLFVVLGSIALAAGQARQPSQPQPSSQQPSPQQPPAQQPPSQTPPPQQPVFRAGVEVLAVDVTVIDGEGRPVMDLLPPEFTVKVDGEVRRVVTAEFVSYEQTGSAAGAVPLAPSAFFTSNAGRAPRRLIILVVDQGNIRAGAGRFAMSAASKFLDKLGPDDQVAFAAIPAPGARVDFTTNHALIKAALNRTVGQAHRTESRFNIGISEAFALQRHSDPIAIKILMDRECGTLTDGSPGRERCELEVVAEASSMVSDIVRQTDQSIAELRDLLEGLRLIDAPKSLVFVSEGLILEGLGTELAGIADAATAARTSIHVLLLDVPRVDVTQADLPPTPDADRSLQTDGLEMLAGMSRGSLFRVYGGAETAFERIFRELSGFYLLGVEAAARDKDGRRHKIDVAVRRRGVTVRSRREFRWTSAMRVATTPTERVTHALAMPYAASDLPVRIASYAYQGEASEKVRIMLAAEIQTRSEQASGLTIGFVVLDRDGKVAAGSMQENVPVPPGSRAGAFDFGATLQLEPGTYKLRMAAVDADGRVGSIEHTLEAFKMSGEELAVGDLMLAPVDAGFDGSVRPIVEARVAGAHLAVYSEVYSNKPGTLGELRAEADVADDEAGAALVRAGAVLRDPGAPDRRVVQGVLNVAALPPGSYVARVFLSRGGELVGKLVRPFSVIAGGAPTAAGGAAPAAALLPPPATFDRAEALQPGVVGAFLDVLERAQAAPAAAVTSAIQRARGGAYAGTAREAFEAGDQLAAAFLRGLELFAQGQIDPAARQFDAALRMAPTFAPGAFYLGACYAAAGRDREATTFWQRALGGGVPAPHVHLALGNAWLRLNDPARAIEALKDGLSRWPEAEPVRRSLGVAYLAAGQARDALATLDPYFERHGTDHELLFAAMHVIYAAHAAGGTVGTRDEDRERFARYARAYAEAKGPNQALVNRWVAFVDSGKR